jgi:DtxR family Mn-dependent transcriptional regulator
MISAAIQELGTLASLTVENYVKAIFKIGLTEDNPRATTGQIAVALAVSPGTVTSMLKTLSESRLASYTPYEGVRLTDAGNQLALRVLRRHRLIETFLAQTLEMGWDEVHDDAEQMEHVISDNLIDRIAARLSHPQFDPHGDPIPTPDGQMPLVQTRSLADCPADTPFRLARVMDQSTDFLRYLSRSGLHLNVQGRVLAQRIEAGAITIEVAGCQTTLGREAAAKLKVAVGEDLAIPGRVSVVPGPHFGGQKARVTL